MWGTGEKGTKDTREGTTGQVDKARETDERDRGQEDTKLHPGYP